MKCKLCKQKTNWDESYGYEEFIVCPKCFEEMAKLSKASGFYEQRAQVLSAIFTIGAQKSRIKKRTKGVK